MKFGQLMKQLSILQNESCGSDLEITINGEPVNDYSVQTSNDTINIVIVPVVKENVKTPVKQTPKGLPGTAKADLPQQ